MMFIESLYQRRLLSAAADFGDDGTLQLGQSIQVIARATEAGGKVLIAERPRDQTRGCAD